MDLKAVEGCSLSMDTPSPDSAADLMTHLNQGCDVVHRLDGLMLSNQDHLSVATIGNGVVMRRHLQTVRMGKIHPCT